MHVLFYEIKTIWKNRQMMNKLVSFDKLVFTVILGNVFY